jgi:hypothetical protein
VIVRFLFIQQKVMEEKMRERPRTLSLSIFLFALVLMISAQAAFAKKASIIPPNSKPYGSSYGEWGAEWWKWSLGIPVAAHPFNPDLNLDCSTEQSGQVWFLGSTIVSEQISPEYSVARADRTCSVPSGKAIFFPVLNVECSQLEGNGDTYEALSECTDFYMRRAVNMSVKVDGVEVTNLQKYRQKSPLFTFQLPEDNFLGIDIATQGSESISVADGVYIMLAPPSTGVHTVQFAGDFIFNEAEDGFDFHFEVDINYELTVGP